MVLMIGPYCLYVLSPLLFNFDPLITSCTILFSCWYHWIVVIINWLWTFLFFVANNLLTNLMRIYNEIIKQVPHRNLHQKISQAPHYKHGFWPWSALNTPDTLITWALVSLSVIIVKSPNRPTSVRGKLRWYRSWSTYKHFYHKILSLIYLYERNPCSCMWQNALKSNQDQR